jgi:hypothetical protein
MRTNALGHWSTYANLLREGSDRSLSRGTRTYRHYRFIQVEGSSGMNVKHQKVEDGREAQGEELILRGSPRLVVLARSPPPATPRANVLADFFCPKI